MSQIEVIGKVDRDKAPVLQPIGGMTKRAFDIFSSVVLLMFFAPVFLLIAAAIKVADPGPVFFGHKRIGQGGGQFYCLKFRTMVVDAERRLEDLLRADEAARKEWSETQKLVDDPRITRLGRFLRVTSLDELPQLVNVLVGNMSLVGPRPIVEAERQHYGHAFSYYLSARPGITGLWQVSGRSDTTYGTRVALDIQYTQGWSLANDLLILFRTVAVVLTRRGSR